MDRQISIRDVLADPIGVADYVIGEQLVYGLVDMQVLDNNSNTAVYNLIVDPWEPCAREGYPRERVNVLLTRHGGAFAFPLPSAEPGWERRPRTWSHRYAVTGFRADDPGAQPALGQLCIWCPDDPRHLRWEPSDGLVAFITMAHRHLMAEEFCRRHGYWPAPAAPHGGLAKSRRADP